MQEDEIELEMTGIREENMRLKSLVQQIENDYKSLQMKFIDVFQESKKKGNSFSTIYDSDKTDHIDDHDQDLVSLRLGSSPTHSKKVEDVHIKNDGILNPEKRLKTEDRDDDHKHKKEDDHESGEKCEVLKRSGDEGFGQTSVKKARVCVRARCDTATVSTIFLFNFFVISF